MKTGLGALVGGAALGVAVLLGFDWSMRATSTDTFCTSCHEMRIPLAQLQATSHFNNRTGVAASCADCHLPQAFLPKIARKAEAVREVWGHYTGIIDTPQKYAAHTPVMKAREIARLKANDSQECRDCHDTRRMLSVIQSSKAQRFHRALANNRRTCIDCHAGIAHPDKAG